MDIEGARALLLLRQDQICSNQSNRMAQEFRIAGLKFKAFGLWSSAFRAERV